jgi:hypothetical protein
MTEIETYFRDVVKLVLGGPRATPAPGTQTFDRTSAVAAPGQPEVTVQHRPPRSQDIQELLTGTFGHSGFRSHQEAVCKRPVTARMCGW